jgi:uncharacterized protein (DUF3084 family)
LADSAGVRSLQHSGRATDTELGQVTGVAGRLKSPCQMHNHVGALEHVAQLVDPIAACQVQRAPLRSRVDAPLRRWTTHDSDDIVLGGQDPEQSGSDVATGSGDDDAHS